MSKKPWKSKEKSHVFDKYFTGCTYEDNEHELVMAVIKEACKEYKQAYKKRNTSKMQALEHWFHGPQFELWSMDSVSPESLLRGIRHQVDLDNNKNYSHMRIREKNNEKNE